MDYWGYPSAAAIGYIHGGMKGAYYGTKSYGKYLSQKNNMGPIKRKRVSKNFPHTQKKRKIGPVMRSGAFTTSRTQYANTPHQNPLNAQAKRASMKRKGRSNVRSIVHRKKRVKVSKPLRKKIQKVIDGQSFKGTYTSTRYGTIGITTTGNAGTANIDPILEDQGGYATQNAFYKIHKDFDGNTRFWFSHALQSTISGSPLVRLEQGSEWQFFSPLKILDAASVLWNSKLAARDYKSQVGNLNSVHQESNGAPVVGTDANPQIKGLKILVDNCYVKFKIKNSSQRAMSICVYNCVPKIKFPENLPLTAFNAALTREMDGANSGYISSVAAGYTSTQQRDSALFNPNVQPNMLPTFSQSWKYEKITIKIAPGETCSHSVQGPKGYLLDYRKLYNAGVNEQGKAFKGTTMCVMMAVQPDMAYARGNVGASTEEGRSGHFGPGQAAANTLADPISVEWTETYRLSCPELVGFKTAAGAAGTMQVLNKKIPRRAFATFSVQAAADGDPTYVAFDEENPAASIAAGLNN